MIKHLVETTKYFEQSISKFWEGIVSIDKNKLIIVADNLLILFIYVILRS
jgi:hypothetical protein